MVNIGIEHEFVFKNRSGHYLDFTNCDYPLFSEIVDRFPCFDGDELRLDCKSTETRPKRCYIEGFDRYNLAGELTSTIPKGLEIRTMPHSDLDELLGEFLQSFSRMEALVSEYGYSPVLTSHHPFLVDCVLGEELNTVELGKRTPEGLQRALRSNLTHGMHVNISLGRSDPRDLADLAARLNYYLPSLIAFTFSAPFYDSGVADVLSARIYRRADTREFVEILVRNGTPVIQIRAFDSCGDSRLLRGVCLLIKGFAENKTLPGRRVTQDSEAIKRSCRHGFTDSNIRSQSEELLDWISGLYPDEHDCLDNLYKLVRGNDCYANRLISRYRQGDSILESISGLYGYS